MEGSGNAVALRLGESDGSGGFVGSPAVTLGVSVVILAVKVGVWAGVFTVGEQAVAARINPTASPSIFFRIIFPTPKKLSGSDLDALIIPIFC